MTLFEAAQYDPRVEARRQKMRRALAALVVLLIVLGGLGWWFRFWPEERVVDKFFAAIEKKDMETAFALWNADPEWRYHTDRYKNYPYGQFELDWGASGDYGAIT